MSAPALASHRPALAPAEGASGPRRSLILAGGGLRVAYQTGVLRALEEADLAFAHADGTSGGIISLGMLMAGADPREMTERWRSLDVRKVVSAAPLRDYLDAPHLMALGDADGLRDRAFPHLGVDPERIRAAEGMEGTFNVCNFTAKTVEAVGHREVDLDLLVAGVSLPILMPPVRRGGAVYTDAVWIKDANLTEAIRRGAEELWVVWCIGNHGAYLPGLVDQYVHMIEMSANGALFAELEQVAALNARIAAGERPGGREGPVRVHLIRPERPLPLDTDLLRGRVDAATLIAMGYRDAMGYLAAADPAGLPLRPEITRMTDPTLGVTFRETMSGPFALGETDPRAVGDRGADAPDLEIRVTIDIADIDAFLGDPEHEAGLTGFIAYPPYGDPIPASGGRFKLFAPAGAPKAKLMVYELAFRHEGRNLYLEGHKDVRDDPGLDLWSDTTTLFTRIHEGAGTDGPVVGAGVLRIDLAGLARMVATMRATNASGAAEATTALARFGRFFLGELWDTYV